MDILSILIREIVINAPALALELVRLFNKPEITEQDWEEARKRVRKSYEDYIKEAQENSK